MVQRDPSSLTAAPHYGGILLPAAIPPALSSYPTVEIERLPRRWRLERKTRSRIGQRLRRRKGLPGTPPGSRRRIGRTSVNTKTHSTKRSRDYSREQFIRLRILA